VKKFIRKVLVDWSVPITIFFVAFALVGAYVSQRITLKLSLTDLLPQDHPSVIKFNRLVKIVGGVGYVEIILHAEDKESHLKMAPALVEAIKADTALVRSAFYHREEYFFLTRALYYADLGKLKELDKAVEKGITRAKRNFFDIGLWDDEEKAAAKTPDIDPEMKKFADRTGRLSPYLLSKDGKDLLVMVKPSFDSMDMEHNKAIISYSEGVLAKTMIPGVSYRFSGRYYSKVVDEALIEEDIYILGILSNVIMALILLFYFRSVRAVISIFIPVVLGLGITAFFTWLFIGHINIITGFLIGIISGVGSDYGIHMLWRLRLEKREPSSEDPDPLWRTLATSGWANFVTIVSSGLCFFLMMGSSFKVFSEFGFICGVGLSAILFAKLGSFYCTSKLLKLETVVLREKYPFNQWMLPILSSQRSFMIGLVVAAFLALNASRVGFEFDFEKMMAHSKELRETGALVDEIYDRSTVPSAFAAPTREKALQVETFLKDKYMPNIVQSIVSGATIVPEQQAEKQRVIHHIEELIHPVRDRELEKAMGASAKAVRLWVAANPFVFNDIPIYIREALRGTEKDAYLVYVYPAEHLNNGPAVARFAGMIKDVEANITDLVSGSDAGIFSDILGLIQRDGIILLGLIVLFVGIFIWINLRSIPEAMLCYLPFLLTLPVSIGVMALFGVKFNMFNTALLPAFVAVGIEIPIQLMQRARETKSGFKAVRDIAVGLQLSLITTAIGFGTMVFTRAGVLKSMGWISLMAIGSIWIIGLFLQPAILERYYLRRRKPMGVTSSQIPVADD
jgi:uncharacterized protein